MKLTVFRPWCATTITSCATGIAQHTMQFASHERVVTYFLAVLQIVCDYENSWDDQGDWNDCDGWDDQDNKADWDNYMQDDQYDWDNWNNYDDFKLG